MTENESSAPAKTVQQAIEEAGSRVLGTISTGAHKLTRTEVQEYHEQNPQEVLAYGGPYTDEADQRNRWTADQGEEFETAADVRERQQAQYRPE